MKSDPIAVDSPQPNLHAYRFATREGFVFDVVAVDCLEACETAQGLAPGAFYAGPQRVPVGRQGARAPRASMTAHVLFADYRTGESLAGVLRVHKTVVISVHETAFYAETARVAAVARAHASNLQVCGDEPPDDSDCLSWDEGEWDVSFHVESFEVKP